MSQVTLSKSPSGHPFVQPIQAASYEKTQEKVVEIALLKIYIASLMSKDLETSESYLEDLGKSLGDQRFCEIMRDTFDVQFQSGKERVWKKRRETITDHASKTLRSVVESPFHFSETFRETINGILFHVAAMAGHLRRIDKDSILSYMREKEAFIEKERKKQKGRELKAKLRKLDEEFYNKHLPLQGYSLILTTKEDYERRHAIEELELTQQELDLAREAKPEIEEKPLQEIQIDFDFGESDPKSRVTMIWLRLRKLIDVAEQRKIVELPEEEAEPHQLFADLDEEETKSTATGTTYHATAELLRARAREEARQLTNMKILQHLKREKHDGVDTVFYYLKGNITEVLTKIRSGTLPGKGATAGQIASAVADMLPTGFSQTAKMIVGAARYFKNRKHVERMFKISAELGGYIDSNKIIEDFAVRATPHYFEKFPHYEEKAYAFFGCIVIKELLVQLMVTEGKVSELTGEALYDRAKANLIHNIEEVSIPTLSTSSQKEH